MKASECLSEIRSRLDSWSVKERKVASYILENTKDSVDPSIEELAERIGVSESTLFRFARKLGYDGYQQFRIALATEAITPRDSWYDSHEPVADEKSAVTVVFRTSVDALESTLAGLDAALLDRAVEAMITATRVPILGVGGSNVVAQDAWHKLVRTGLPCEAPVDFHAQLMLASQSGPGSFTMLFSHTGSNTDAIALADEAKFSGSSLLVVTSQPRSPLARRADFLVISRGSGARLVSEAWSARIAQLAIVDTLYVLAMEKLGESGERHLQAMRRAIARRRL